ncbi:MAG TPA: VOC family metalloprotein YjdN [Burkholderiaceae bacterium]|jgi:PhnB protein|nr:VOC family metalloprotein YjdN [Burkholderiaceae bacterium]
MQITPYLSFDGRCEKAVEFYKSRLGAQLMFITKFKDAPPDSQHMGKPDDVMHCTLKIGDSILHASDGVEAGKGEMKGITLSISSKDVAEGKRLFDALSEKGQVVMPFQKTFWAEGFGMVNDQFGVPWMVNVEA